MLGAGRRTGSEQRSRENATVQIIVFLTAILTGSAALASQYTQLPWWYRYPLALFTFVSLVVLVKTFVWPPLRSAVTVAVNRRRLNQTSKRITAEFQDIVRRFQEFINVQSQETLPVCLIDLRNREPALRTRLPATPQLLFMSELFTLFLRDFRQWDGRYGQLRELAQEFFVFLHQYDTTYVFEPLNSIRSLNSDELPEYLRNKINLLRENYAAFLRDYVSFAKRANARFGENVFVEYMRLPEPV